MEKLDSGQGMDTTAVGLGDSARKQSYHKPQLTVYGSVRDLTKLIKVNAGATDSTSPYAAS